MIVSEQPKNWVDNGYGVPRLVHAIYIVKLVFFYVLGGIVVVHGDLRPPRVLACRALVE